MLFSGLMECGGRGAGFSKISKEYFGCSASYAELLAVLRSHFGYEETRLAPIMGRLKMFG